LILDCKSKYRFFVILRKNVQLSFTYVHFWTFLYTKKHVVKRPVLSVKFSLFCIFIIRGLARIYSDFKLLTTKDIYHEEHEEH
jgi:hypothetical protein